MKEIITCRKHNIHNKHPSEQHKTRHRHSKLIDIKHRRSTDTRKKISER